MNVADHAKIDFERGMSSAPVVTISLIVANTAVFLIMAASGALRNEATVLAAGALSHELVLHGQAWRLASAMFLHGSLDHLVGNGIGLYIVGMAAEHTYGKIRIVVMYLLAGLCGNVFSTVINPGPSLRASGAIFGLLGAMIMFFARYREHFHVRDIRIGNVLLLWAGYSVLTAFFIPFIDNAAHVGGLIGGAFAGMWITPRMMKEV